MRDKTSFQFEWQARGGLRPSPSLPLSLSLILFYLPQLFSRSSGLFLCCVFLSFSVRPLHQQAVHAVSTNTLARPALTPSPMLMMLITSLLIPMMLCAPVRFFFLNVTQHLLHIYDAWPVPPPTTAAILSPSDYRRRRRQCIIYKANLSTKDCREREGEREGKMDEKGSFSADVCGRSGRRYLKYLL